jgi:hypothetical protein
VDNLSPNLFYLYVNDLPSYFDKSCDPVSLYKYDLNCLMYADGVVLLSSSEKGLQNCINQLANFATDWKISLNTKNGKCL